MKFFNDLADFNAAEIRDLVAFAHRLDENPQPRALEGKVLALLFLNPSLRTLASFQSAMTRLGGGVFVISPEMSIHNIESRSGIVMDGAAAEHIREAVPVIASYSDAIGIRAFAKRENLAHDLHDTQFHEMTSLIDIALYQYGIGHQSSLSKSCRLENPGRPGHSLTGRQVCTFLELAPAANAIGNTGGDCPHGCNAGHGGNGIATAGI